MNYLEILENLGAVKTTKDKIEGFYTNIENSLVFCERERLPSNTIYSVCQKTGYSIDSFRNELPTVVEFLEKFLCLN